MLVYNIKYSLDDSRERKTVRHFSTEVENYKSDNRKLSMLQLKVLHEKLINRGINIDFVKLVKINCGCMYAENRGKHEHDLEIKAEQKEQVANAINTEVDCSKSPKSEENYPNTSSIEGEIHSMLEGKMYENIQNNLDVEQFSAENIRTNDSPETSLSKIEERRGRFEVKAVSDMIERNEIKTSENEWYENKKDVADYETKEPDSNSFEISKPVLDLGKIDALQKDISYKYNRAPTTERLIKTIKIKKKKDRVKKSSITFNKKIIDIDPDEVNLESSPELNKDLRRCKNEFNVKKSRKQILGNYLKISIYYLHYFTFLTIILVAILLFSFLCGYCIKFRHSERYLFNP